MHSILRRTRHNALMFSFHEGRKGCWSRATSGQRRPTVQWTKGLDLASSFLSTTAPYTAAPAESPALALPQVRVTKVVLEHTGPWVCTSSGAAFVLQAGLSNCKRLRDSQGLKAKKDDADVQVGRGTALSCACSLAGKKRRGRSLESGSGRRSLCS